MVAYRYMKMKFLLAVLGTALLAVGCVSTVDGHKKAATPFLKDKVMGQYERPMDQVYDAAKTVVTRNGQLLTESNIHSSTNRVEAIVGRVNQRDVWVRVEALDPKITQVTVQVRTRAGGRDLDLAHELEKEVALELAK